jgi:hypothetical protein
MPETKNVLELMTEMLHEQENYKLRSSCANEENYISNINGDKTDTYDNKVVKI